MFALNNKIEGKISQIKANKSHLWTQKVWAFVTLDCINVEFVYLFSTLIVV